MRKRLPRPSKPGILAPALGMLAPLDVGPEGRLQAQGYGKNRPIKACSKSKKAGCAANRRAGFIILKRADN